MTYKPTAADLFANVVVESAQQRLGEGFMVKDIFFTDEINAARKQTQKQNLTPGLFGYLETWLSKVISQSFHPFCLLEQGDAARILPTPLVLPMNMAASDDIIDFLNTHFVGGNSENGRIAAAVEEEEMDWGNAAIKEDYTGNANCSDGEDDTVGTSPFEDQMLRYADVSMFAVSAIVSDKCPRCSFKRSCQQYQLGCQLLAGENPVTLWERSE